MYHPGPPDSGWIDTRRAATARARYDRPVALRVLLIEDDLFAAARLADALRTRGWDVDHVASGPEGLTRALRERPAVVISDLSLPGMDGATIAASLRLAPGLRTPVILLCDGEASAEFAVACGADTMIEKPVSADELHLRLRALVDEATGDEDSLAPGAIRVPDADVLASGRTTAPTRQGIVRPGWLRDMVALNFDRRESGILEVQTGCGRTKLYFHRGAPAAARSSERGTELGQVLHRLGILTADQVDQAVAEARRKRRPLADELIASAQVGRPLAERALREQIIERMQRLDTATDGRWTFTLAEPLGLPGYEVPAGIAWWRLGGGATGPPADRARHVRLLAGRWAWAVLDPTGELAPMHALFLAGASVADCVTQAPEVAERLIRVLRRFALLALLDEAPTDRQRAEGLAMVDTATVEAALAVRCRAIADANHYAILGLAPDALPAEVHAANARGVAEHDPLRLPSGVSAVTRERAQSLYARVLDAGRVLMDPERRALYDAMLGRRVGWLTPPRNSEDHAVLLAERAQQCFRRGEYVTAASLLQSALHLEGVDADILGMLGRTRRLACPEDPAAGEPELRHAIQLSPDAEFPLYWLGRLHYERGESDDARRLLRRILIHNPEFELARETMRLLST